MLICLNHQGRIFVFSIILLFQIFHPSHSDRSSTFTLIWTQKIQNYLTAPLFQVAHLNMSFVQVSLEFIGAPPPPPLLLVSLLLSPPTLQGPLVLTLFWALPLSPLHHTAYFKRTFKNKRKWSQAGVSCGIKQEIGLNPTLHLIASSQKHRLDSSLVVASSVLPARPSNSLFLYQIQL